MQYITLLSLLPAVMAYGYGSSDETTTAVAPVAAAQTSGASAVNGVHIVKVGQNGLTFEPNNMTVPVGDTVEFHFWPKAHSVAQSSFDAPCQPLNTTSFFSGPVQIASGMSPTVYSIVVNSTAPLWYYCATGQHCQGGMAGVINAPAANLTRTISNYQILAARQGVQNVAPASVQGGTLGAASSGTPTTSGTGTNPTSTGAANKGAISWGLLGVAGLIGAAVV